VSVEALERGGVVLSVDFGYGLVPPIVRFVYHRNRIAETHARLGGILTKE
jgi:hypothetical protein